MLHNIALQLYIAAKIRPEMWDYIIPMAPKYSKGTRKMIAGQIVKSVTKFIKNDAVKNDLYIFGGSLYSSGTKTMSYDDDDICPRPRHFPWPWPHNDDIFSELNPQPMPPVYYAAVLRLVAQSLDEKDLSASLEGLADRI